MSSWPRPTNKPNLLSPKTGLSDHFRECITCQSKWGLEKRCGFLHRCGYNVMLSSKSATNITDELIRYFFSFLTISCHCSIHESQWCLLLLANSHHERHCSRLKNKEDPFSPPSCFQQLLKVDVSREYKERS